MSAESAKFWDKRAEDYNNRSRDNAPNRQNDLAEIKTNINGSDTVLEFGCATGDMSLALAPHVEQVVGVDISPKMVEIARSKLAESSQTNLSFSNTNVFDVSFEADQFDAILAFNVFHLTENPAEVVGRLKNLLKPGGVIISETPCLSNRKWPMRLSIRLAQRVGLVPKIHSFDTINLRKIFTDNQMEIKKLALWDQDDQVYWVVASKPAQNRATTLFNTGVS